MSFSIFLLTFFLLFYGGATLSNHPIVIVVSFDGLRYNYISKETTPNLAKYQEEGCTADYLENVFMTKTFTNHMSIATGLYADGHGVMANSMYDPKTLKPLEVESYDFWHYKRDIKPIWIENELKGEGRHSGIMMWPGGGFNYSGISPTWQVTFNGSMSSERRIDAALSWILDDEKPANLIFLYVEEPDAHGHAFGPDSPQNKLTIQKMDNVAKYLMERLDALELAERTNVFFVSDHGMQTVTPADMIDLNKFVEQDLYDQFAGTPVLFIVPKPGKELVVSEKLQAAANTVGGFKVYKTEDIPERWHYKNDRAPPLLLVADPPHVFNDFEKQIEYYKNKYNLTVTANTTFGVHGYDNLAPNMRPYFIAIGPDVNARTRVPAFRTIDLFAVWAKLLGFPEAISKTESSLVPAQLILKTIRPKLTVLCVAAILLGVGLVISAMLITVYLVHRRMRNRYYTLLQTDESGADSRQRLLESEEEAA